jgi:signal transduction histidine kinase
MVSKAEIERLSAAVRALIDGQAVDVRDHREGAWSVLKNDIHTLADKLNQQASSVAAEREAMSQTLAAIAHQLKTPLTSALLMADLLAEAPAEQRADFTANLRQALLQADWLVTALLKQAQLDAGVITFKPESVVATELVAEALEPLRVVLDRRDQVVEVTGQAELTCDRRWTAEALTNLLKNGSEQSPAGTRLRVVCGQNPIATWIAITDAGEGISDTAKARLFQRFESSRPGSGFGIGLPLALAIAKAQGGDIDVDSAPGAGATFTFKLYR